MKNPRTGADARAVSVPLDVACVPPRARFTARFAPARPIGSSPPTQKVHAKLSLWAVDGDLFPARRNRFQRHGHRPIFGSPTRVPGNRATLIGAHLGRCHPRAPPLSSIRKSTRPKPSAPVSFFWRPLSADGFIGLDHERPQQRKQSPEWQGRLQEPQEHKNKNDSKKNTDDKTNDNNDYKDSNRWWQ